MHNGMHLKSFKHLCKDGSIRIMPAPDVVRLSLQQHADALLHSCVQSGEHVTLGQVIAKPHVTHSAWLHSPISGVIECVNDKDILIRNDHQDQHCKSNVPFKDWQACSTPELIAHLAQGGIAGLGGAAYSTAAKLSASATDTIDTLIINGMECEPFIACDDYLMREQATSILQGVQILLHASYAQHAHIAIEDDKQIAINAMNDALKQLNDERIQLRVLHTTYPGGDEGQLIKRLLKKEIPRGALPSSIGVLVNNVATAHACSQWIHKLRPLISRVVTVTGHGIREACNVDVCIGTACSAVIAFCGGYQDTATMLIMGGSMMGKAMPSDTISISKASNCLIAATTMDIAPEYSEQPCIRCGECSHACPVDLLPQQLLMHLRNQNTPASLELGLRDCIECGCCDTVCPSHIALASRFRAAKLQLQ